MSETAVENPTAGPPLDEPVIVDAVADDVPKPASTPDGSITTRQSREEATIEARQFVYDQSFGTLTTINQSGNFEGFPAGQIEYYIDDAEQDATLLLIAVDMSSAFRNIGNGSPCSLAIRTGDQPNGETPLHAAAAKRIILYGEFDYVEPSLKAKAAFFAAHPDALEWAPGVPGFHKTQWIRFTITGIHYIGGFGDRHYIGSLPVDKYVDAPVNERCKHPESDSLLSRLSRMIWR